MYRSGEKLIRFQGHGFKSQSHTATII